MGIVGLVALIVGTTIGIAAGVAAAIAAVIMNLRIIRRQKNIASKLHVNVRLRPLREVDLSGLDLSGADLRDVNLSGADLRDVNLSGADLSGADLRDVNLSGAKVSQEQLPKDPESIQGAMEEHEKQQQNWWKKIPKNLFKGILLAVQVLVTGSGSIKFSFSLSGRRATIGVIVFGGILVLVFICLLIYGVIDVVHLQGYQAGSCTITAKRLLQQEGQETIQTSDNTSMTTTVTGYTPDFQFTVQTADGGRYAVREDDLGETSDSDRGSQQAILDQYTVGKTYPCWYDPANPTQAVLKRQIDWAVFFVSGLFLFVGVMFVLIGYLLLRL
jgi:hypothetical protein